MKLIKLVNLTNTFYYSIKIDNSLRTVVRRNLKQCLSLDLNDGDYITKLSFTDTLEIVWELEFENIEDLIELIPEEFL